MTDAMITGEKCSGEIVLKDENLLGKYEVSVTRTDQEKKKELILNQAKQELQKRKSAYHLYLKRMVIMNAGFRLKTGLAGRRKKSIGLLLTAAAR